MKKGLLIALGASIITGSAMGMGAIKVTFHGSLNPDITDQETVITVNDKTTADEALKQLALKVNSPLRNLIIHINPRHGVGYASEKAPVPKAFYREWENVKKNPDEWQLRYTLVTPRDIYDMVRYGRTEYKPIADQMFAAENNFSFATGPLDKAALATIATHELARIIDKRLQLANEMFTYQVRDVIRDPKSSEIVRGDESTPPAPYKHEIRDPETETLVKVVEWPNSINPYYLKKWLTTELITQLEELKTATGEPIPAARPIAQIIKDKIAAIDAEQDRSKLAQIIEEIRAEILKKFDHE